MKSYYDIVGDGGSDVLGQVQAKQAAIARNLAGVGRRVAVGSGKGGVGKSTVTMALARGLVARGRSVAIFDLDLNGPCQARLGGLPMAPPVPGAKGLVPPRTREGISVVSMGTLVPETEAVEFDSVVLNEAQTWRGTKEFTMLGELLATVEWGDPDYLLFDLPPGAERIVQYADFLGPATDFVLVTTPSDLSRGVVSRSLAALRGKPNRVLGYVSNMDGYCCPGCDEVHPLFPESARPLLEAERLGTLAFSPALAGAGAANRSGEAPPGIGGIIERIEQGGGAGVGPPGSETGVSV